MLPLLKTRLEVGAIAVALLIGVVALKEHDDKVRQQAVAQAVVDTAKKDQATYAQQVSDLAKQMDARDATYQASLKSLQGQFQAAATPAQIAQLVSTLMGLKQPLTVVTPAPTAANPNPQSVVQVPQVDFPQAKSYIQDCETCKLNLSKVTADAADRQAQANLAQLQIDSLKKENTALAVEAKGGTTWHRTVKALKYIGIGAIGGAVAVCATSHCK